MRYLLFAGSQYYPGGGYNDFVCRVGSVDAAIERLRQKPYHEDGDYTEEFDWYEIVDSETDRAVQAGLVNVLIDWEDSTKKYADVKICPPDERPFVGGFTSIVSG